MWVKYYSVSRRKKQMASVFSSYRKNNSMSSLPEGCLSNKEIFYLIKGILTLHQPFYQCDRDLSSLFHWSSWQLGCQVCKPWHRQQSLFRSLLPVMETPGCLMQQPIQQCTCNLCTQQQVHVLTLTLCTYHLMPFLFPLTSLLVAYQQ